MADADPRVVIAGAALTLRLPPPPSVNHYWRHVILGRRVCTLLSAEGRAYKAAAAACCLQQQAHPLEGPLEVELVWHRPQRRGDLDNHLKAPLDAVRGFAYHDDKQIVALHAFMVDDDSPGCVLTVTPVIR